MDSTTATPTPTTVRPPNISAPRRAHNGPTLPTIMQRRRGSVVSPEDSQTVESSVTAPDMTLNISSVGHKSTVLNCVKKHVFPRCKFITSNSDLDYDAKGGICGFMIVQCGVSINSREWWSFYKLTVKRTIADHRNNRIKRMQQLYIGKS